MTLLQLVQTLSTKNVKITVKDGDSDNEIITFFSPCISGVEGDVSARNVRRWELTGAQSIVVVLDAAV